MAHIYTSDVPDVEIPEIPVHEYVFRDAATYPDRIAIVDGPTGRSYTYGTLVEMVAQLAGGLHSRGFGKGDCLAIVAPNLPEYAIIFHAVSKLGGTVTTVNPTYTAEEFAYQFNDAKATIAVTIGMFLDHVREAAAQSGVEEVFVLGDGDAPSVLELFGEPFTGSVDIDVKNDVVVLPYSSGTTGLPKGVMLTHHNLVANLVQTRAVSALAADDESLIAVLPFFHIYGMQVLMNSGFDHGAKLVTMPRFDLEMFLSLIQEHKITRAYVVPPIILALAKHPMVDQYDLSSLKQIGSGAAPLGTDLEDAAGVRIGCPVTQGYGLTETAPVTNFNSPEHRKAGTVGPLVPNLEMRIVDPDTGEDGEPNIDGEIWFRGPNIMKGYLGRADETGAMLDSDGWLHTGDIGNVDDDGYLKITDRLKELIKYKGFQVAPAELEALLVAHPKVADVAVIGVPDEEAGELPKAFIVKADDSLTPDEVIAYSLEHVAHYKQIRMVEFVDEIPKSASGKILRRLLRDQ